MNLKGVMTIELTDANTGAVETVTEENMITESVNNILGLNPMGIFTRQPESMTMRFSGTGTFFPSAPT